MLERLNGTPDTVIFLVVRNDGKLLFEKRTEEGDQAFGKTVVPAGKIREGETPQEALKRELGEELGILPLMYFGLGAIRTETGRLASVVLITDYQGEITNKEGRNSHVWLCPDSAEDVLGFDSSKTILKKALKFLPPITQALEAQRKD